VLHIFQYGECITDVLMTFDAFDTCYKTNAARIVLK
jgi:hypothetical protein